MQLTRELCSFYCMRISNIHTRVFGSKFGPSVLKISIFWVLPVKIAYSYHGNSRGPVRGKIVNDSHIGKWCFTCPALKFSTLLCKSSKLHVIFVLGTVSLTCCSTGTLGSSWSAISKIGNGEWRNGERGTGNL